MKIKQLKEKTAQGLKDFLPKIGVGDIEGLLTALNDKLSKSQGGEINKPIVITNKDSNYSLTINPDSIYIWDKKLRNNIFKLSYDKGMNIIDIGITSGKPVQLNAIKGMQDAVGNIIYYNGVDGKPGIFYSRKYVIIGGTDKQVLLGDGSTTGSLIKRLDITEHNNRGFWLTSTLFDGTLASTVSFDGATNKLAGLMTAVDKAKLDNIPNIYAEKSKTISNITVGNRPNKRGLYIAIDYADRTNPGTTVNIPNATTTSDGCMSYEDKNKLDNIENTYISSQNGNIYSSYDTNNGNSTLDVTGNYDEEGSGGRIALKRTEDGKGKLSIMLDGSEGSVNAETFKAITNPNENEVWCTNGSRLNVLNLLSNAAIYVAGGFELAESGIDNTTVIDSPDRIIYDDSVLGGRFLARKGMTCYTHWKADISKNIAPPSRYGIETDNGVFPFNNQMYKFSTYDDIFITTCFNGTCSMKKLTLK